MPRYELSEGTSNKFWDIALSGASFTTTFGKIGATGQTTIKKFGSDAEAKVAYDKIVAEKVKKGYQPVGGKAAPAKAGKSATAEKPAKAGKAATKAAPADLTRDARNPDLEKAIAANPGDREAYSVFADWLLEQGDPRGELIQLGLGNRDKAAKQLIDKHAVYFLGPLVDHQKTRDGLGNNSISHLRTSAQEKEWQKVGEQAFLWRNGYIHRVRLSHDSYFDGEWKGKTSEVLDQVLSHPSGRYVVEFSFQSNGDPSEGNLQSLIDVLGKKAPPTTRKITFGDNVDQISWHHTGNLGKLWKGVPGLKTLEIETGDFDVGKMEAPNLERAVFITGGLTSGCCKNIAKAVMPKIKHLELYFGNDEYGGDCSITDLKALLARTDLKQLSYLGLKNATFANDIAAAVGKAAIVKGLKTLDLSRGTMTDEGALALGGAKPALWHLDVLDVSNNYLTKKGIAMLQGAAKKVISGGQKESEGDGDDAYYYVDIAE